MKAIYKQPDVQVITLQPRDGVLVSASNEGFPVDPFNPGFVCLFFLEEEEF